MYLRRPSSATRAGRNAKPAHVDTPVSRGVDWAAMLATTVSLWPYSSGNTLVDVLLFGVWCFLFGLFFSWGERVAGKLP